MSITEERMQVVDFTNKYYNTPSWWWCRLLQWRRFPESLSGLRLGVLKGSTQEAFAVSYSLA